MILLLVEVATMKPRESSGGSIEQEPAPGNGVFPQRIITVNQVTESNAFGDLVSFTPSRKRYCKAAASKVTLPCGEKWFVCSVYRTRKVCHGDADLN